MLSTAWIHVYCYFLPMAAPAAASAFFYGFIHARTGIYGMIYELQEICESLNFNALISKAAGD